MQQSARSTRIYQKSRANLRAALRRQNAALFSIHPHSDICPVQKLDAKLARFRNQVPVEVRAIPMCVGDGIARTRGDEQFDGKRLSKRVVQKRESALQSTADVRQRL